MITAGLLAWLGAPRLIAWRSAPDSEGGTDQIQAIHGDDLYQPSVGQDGKNVIWVPTQDDLMQAMLEALNIQPDDILYDLGSGDGKIVINAAQQYNINAVGIEYDPQLVELAKRNAARAGVEDQTTFVRGDIFQEDFSNASAVALYLLPELNLKLKPTILSMRPGTRVVSNTFDMGTWPADTTIELDRSTRAYYWVVPARVQGRWQLEDSTNNTVGELDLRQEFQLVGGEVVINGEVFTILSGRMEGEAITFTYGHRTANGDRSHGSFQGTVRADRLQGTLNKQAKQQQLTGRLRASQRQGLT